MTVLAVPDSPAAADLQPGPAGRAAVAPASLGLAWILADLAGRGTGKLMVGGGAVLLGQFLSARLADELLLAIAPVFVADLAAPRLLGSGGRGRMRLAGVSQAGDMAVLRYLPAT